MKYNAALFLLLFVIVLSVSTGTVFASEGKEDSRDDDSRDDDSRDDDSRDDDSRDDDSRDDDKSNDSSQTSEFSERKVRAETLGFQTEIKIEIEFVSNTTDTNQIIDQIIDKFSLTREEAEKELRTERSDDRSIEEKFEVEIEKRGNISKVKVELETVIDSTSRGDILDATVKNSQLTREQINEQLRFDSDDNTSSRDDTDNSNSSESERLRQENQQLRDDIKQLNLKLDNLQRIIMEQMNVIMETLKSLKSQ